MRLNWLARVGVLLTGLALAAFCCPGVSLAGVNHQDKQEKIMVPTQPASSSPGVKLPPLDAAVPAHIETATFSLG